MKADIPVDVAIVGYGPTGQLLALMLGRAGHRVTVVERWPDLYPLPRAVHYDHEIARLFQVSGVMDDIKRIVEPTERYQWRNANHDVLMDFNWSGTGPSGWPVSTMFAQPELERVLDTHVRRLPNVTVRSGWSAAAVHEDADGVRIDIEAGQLVNGKWTASGDVDTVRARYVVGADGANSVVRQALGIAFEDLGFAFDWLVIDVKPTEPREWVPKTWQLCDPARPTSIVPGGPGRRRWEFMLLPGETAEQMNQDSVAWDLLARWDIAPHNAILERHAVYTFRGRWAKDWRAGRVLLAGDAAHLMPPFAGQGMCSGLRDAAALAWRLDGILSGTASERLLDSYGPERLNHVREMIGFSIELGKVICITDPAAAAARDAAMLAAQAMPGFTPPASPQPRLGAGLYDAQSPGSGWLTPQGVVEFEGRCDLFDDVFGAGFALIARDQAALDALSRENRDALDAQGVTVAHFGPGGFRDVNGVYAKYLTEHDALAVLVRPDFYSYGAARTAHELDALVDAWRLAMEPA
ncbi:bifunctional 3-(3-hydroxy-phenyl)propionate/3-hydroxycinnamic acid hydroxylase [Pararobbsia silviterrae]|uniref:Bifunctional 3-(3-hydroxy-phenyl)propionate/3-hydroxycinnamic acid hydroxylase n=1 Tax=Pararobbsia silviterrae TaxID=1792498 RepID=A0A494XZ06_9BURK|nr:bifunctional 3-(3-hydroxy-phenyl)propionate/3-hydroxycinnamic acid hydroxylase [Pararobbsia silviterrae]RKP53364.1 bifunctional 3-(3-hydroxy-phenyl)propionate/3-hydroxycinnamic acid hydroxylase [Pararobbsia silviterrae]